MHFVLVWIVLMGLLLFLRGEADAFDVFQLREVTVIYRSYESGGVDPLITQNPYQPDKSLGQGLDLVVNVDLLKFLYWDNTVHSMTDRNATNAPGQFRMVGLEWGLGIDLKRVWRALPLSIGRYHYSRHLLDTEYGLGHFPLLDAWEIRLKLYERN